MHPRIRSRAGVGLVLLAVLSRSMPLAAQDAQAQKPFKTEEIEQLVAPIALYPDSLLAQVFMASTYPLEVVEAARWSKANSGVKGKALEAAMQKQTWDASVKSLTAFPPVLEMLNEKLDWTQKLGDAFLAQQADVMDAVQRLRAKAKSEGNLETNKEQKVIVEEVPPAAGAGGDQTTIVKIEPADPQVVYVPTYNPTVVYGTWPYPAYPPAPYYPPGYLATSILSFGVGMAAGAALWGGCNWGWGGGNVNVNVNNYNNFNRTDIKNGNWEHNSDHRKGVQYRDKGTQDRFGKGQRPGADSREAFRGRAEQGRQDIGRTGADRMQRDMARQQPRGADRPGGVGDQRAGQRPAQRDVGGGGRGAGNQQRAGAGGLGDQQRAAQRHQAAQPRAFDGIGNGNAARQDSARGSQSRQSAGSGGRSGGSRAGAGGGGGGGRGGGGGGRGGGGGGRRR
jgi:uncharacterized membrane protein YgcG